MADPIWQCTRQRAGPLVKECRALRPRLLATDSRQERREKNEIVRSPHSAVCRSQADRLELRLALLGLDSTHYILTYDSDHLPATFPDARRGLRAFFARCRRWKGRRFDYIYCIEGKHGDHRYHVHLVLRYADFSPAEVRHLWRCGEVDDEPVLRREGGFRRLAEYLNKESTDGIVIPISRRPWTCSRGLSQGLPPPERWTDSSGVIEIPDGVRWATRGSHQNDFGAYFYASYILPGK